ncbi:MAG: ring-cleaving dioxygenase [Acidobacteriota bacterium]
MAIHILGLHHVTATVDQAQADLDFFAGDLGMRLVKKTVNFDNRHVYHFYYGDTAGTPGTIWTTFPYHGHGVRKGQHGSGQVTATTLSVPAGSLDFWLERLAGRGFSPLRLPSRFGEAVVAVTDPSGLTIELVATERDQREPWLATGVTLAQAVRGVHSVTMTIASPSETLSFMTSVLGFTTVATEGDRTRLAIGGPGPGHEFDVVAAPSTLRGMNGVGTVHHVAMAVATSDEQARIRKMLLDLGVQVTRILDRQYFQSIYFREPGGVLFEIATAQPGFAIDEAPEALGRGLKLPPWEETHRSDIEAGLPPLILPP